MSISTLYLTAKNAVTAHRGMTGSFICSRPFTLCFSAPRKTISMKTVTFFSYRIKMQCPTHICRTLHCNSIYYDTGLFSVAAVSSGFFSSDFFTAAFLAVGFFCFGSAWLRVSERLSNSNLYFC